MSDRRRKSRRPRSMRSRAVTRLSISIASLARRQGDLVVDQLSLKHRDGSYRVAFAALRNGGVAGNVVSPYGTRFSLRIADIPHIELAERRAVAQVRGWRTNLSQRRQADEQHGHKRETRPQSIHDVLEGGTREPCTILANNASADCGVAALRRPR